MKSFLIIIRENHDGFFGFCEQTRGVFTGENIPDLCKRIGLSIEGEIERSSSDAENKEVQILSESKVSNTVLPNPYADKSRKIPEDEAAAFLGISKQTLRRIRKNELIDSYKVHRKISFSIQELENYQEKHLVKSRTGKYRAAAQKKLP